MTLSDLAAIVTGERSLDKHNGDAAHPSRTEIARLAYELFEMRGRQNGHDVDDWLSAERQLLHHYR